MAVKHQPGNIFSPKQRKKRKRTRTNSISFAFHFISFEQFSGEIDSLLLLLILVEKFINNLRYLFSSCCSRLVTSFSVFYCYELIDDLFHTCLSSPMKCSTSDISIKSDWFQNQCSLCHCFSFEQ